MGNERSKKGERAPANVFVIFGASGDLTKRKLVPALYNLHRDGLLPESFAIVGVARRPMTDLELRATLREQARPFLTGADEQARWDWIESRLYSHTSTFSDAEGYARLADRLRALDAERHTDANYLFYLATPPKNFGEIARNLYAAGLLDQEHGWRRVVVEKPFGHDLDSARALNRELGQVLSEDQIYRIDHYLGKETVQNILMLRFANGIFEPIWNRSYIDHVQITVAETVGVGTRAGYYDESGALRDMVQNHLLQLLALTAMEPPVSFDADAVRDEKGKVLRAIQPIEPEEVLTHVVRGQYDAGTVAGVDIGGYRDEEDVPENSRTETFVAMELAVDNWRWADVPFYLRTGKCLPERVTEVAIQFKRAPLELFRHTAVDHLPPNMLVIHLQPNEGITLSFQAKVPGPVMRMEQVGMNFDYEEHFGLVPSTGYETLVYDCMCGDATLFQRSDNVEAGWRAVTPILDVWRALPPRDFPNYRAGTWGPPDAATLLSRHGRKWRIDR